MKLTTIVIASALAAVVAGATPSAADEATEVLSARINTIHETGGLAIGTAKIAGPRVMAAVYTHRDFALAWTRPTMIDELMRAIDETPDHGLDPFDYHAEAIRSRLELAARGMAGATSLVDLDLLLTDALARLAVSLHFGKLAPEDLDPVWNLSREFEEGAHVVEILAGVLDSGQVARFLESVAPPGPFYNQMVQAMRDYRVIAADGGWPSVPDGPVLKPEERDARVRELRHRLVVTGDLATVDAADPELYDAAVEEAVSRFQNRHLLDVDGKVGPKTLAVLNVPVEDRIAQLRVNLERTRWVFRDVVDDFVVADIAGFRLYLYRDQEPVWTTRIQVGKPYHATPIFKAEMTYIVLNPTWTVPPGILRNETLPAIREDPEYLENQNMSVIRSDGSVVDPSTVDFSASFPYGIRQEPGPGNALGRVKFMFPNPYFVYLHDTPSKSLFGRSARAFSHGCIRTENPLDLAELLLADQGWNRARIDRVIETERLTNVTLDEPLTVFLLYWTTIVRPDGTVEFRDDIYDRDGQILEGLNAPFNFKPPGNVPEELR